MAESTEVVRIEKLVHGGQGLATLANGQKAFVWNALPGEQVRVRVFRKKRSFVEAVAEEVVEASPERVAPQEANYLATSPWQIMQPAVEGRYKQQITEELFRHEHVELPENGVQLATQDSDDAHFFHYRNKMEYSFWGDDEGLHIALHNRGSHQKSVVTGSKLALPAIDEAARAVLAVLQKQDLRAGDLKTMVIRCSQDGHTAVSLFTKLEEFPRLPLPEGVQGLRAYYSNPKSPASVPTKRLYELGDVRLHDALLDQDFVYDVDSFFQVNIPVFEQALKRIKEFCGADEVTDMYAGVGSIGLSVAGKSVDLIELDPATAAMARVNAANSPLEARVVEQSAETEPNHYIYCDGGVLVFDPPRAGLHQKVVAAVEAILPPKIIYLSCNPATQARDLALLQDSYVIEHLEVFNFFPRTPHIECLAVLTAKD
ncbi:MAG TPA: TRAM domain-containing protein [Candidatus Saccharimonadales bacterium]|nr:TRAM domain-containing protein [Candidatus Saccharimonadales bacterium]